MSCSPVPIAWDHGSTIHEGLDKRQQLRPELSDLGYGYHRFWKVDDSRWPDRGRSVPPSILNCKISSHLACIYITLFFQHTIRLRTFICKVNTENKARNTSLPWIRASWSLKSVCNRLLWNALWLESYFKSSRPYAAIYGSQIVDSHNGRFAKKKENHAISRQVCGSLYCTSICIL